MREFTEDDLLTLELRVQKEGVLDRQAALDLIEIVRDQRQELEALEHELAQDDRGYQAGYDDGYDDGCAAKYGQG